MPVIGPTGRIRVLVVDDHRIFAESLATALAAEPDVDVSAAGSASAARRCLERADADNRPYDVLLVDADLATPSPPGPPGSPVSGTAGPRWPASGTRTPATGPRSVAATGRPTAGRLVAVPLVLDPRSAPPSLTEPLIAAARPDDHPDGAGNRLCDGISLVNGFRADHPSIRVVVLAERDDARRAARALQAGASGWVAKDCSLVRLLTVVRGVLRGETHLPPALLTGVLREMIAERRHRTEGERLVESLTPREREVLRCMVAGLGRKDVAERLYLSPHTVRTHMQNVLGKLGVHSTLAAVALARRAGVDPVDLLPLPGNVVERSGQLS